VVFPGWRRVAAYPALPYKMPQAFGGWTWPVYATAFGALRAELERQQAARSPEGLADWFWVGGEISGTYGLARGFVAARGATVPPLLEVVWLFGDWGGTQLLAVGALRAKLER